MSKSSPTQITWRGMEPSPALEAKIHERARKLERTCGDIIGCQVVVEQLHRHKHHGNLFNVRVAVDVPGKHVVGGHEHPKDHAHEDVYVALRDAFRATKRQLEEHVRRRRGDVKTH